MAHVMNAMLPLLKRKEGNIKLRIIAEKIFSLVRNILKTDFIPGQDVDLC